MKNPIAKFVLFLGIMSFLTGCQTYQQQSALARQHWDKGNFAEASVEYGKLATKNNDTKDHIIMHLEHGNALRNNGQTIESNSAFDKAESKIDEFEEKAKISVSTEVGATLTNQANLPYRGKEYDKIMLNSYKALNYWEQGDFGRVRTEIFTAYKRQENAVDANKKAIEKAQQEEADSKESEAINNARNDEGFSAKLTEISTSLDGLSAYGDYVNPFTVFLDGLYFANHSESASDLSRANQAFTKLKVFSPENKYIDADLSLLETKVSGMNPTPTTYVIFETGMAPSREQIRIDIPIIVSNVSYVGAAFPKLVFHSDYHNYLNVNANGQSYKTLPIASLDNIIGNAFKKELPVIISKTIVSTVTKAVAAYAMNKAADQQDAVVGLIMKIGTAAAQASVNIADLRTWSTLPKEFQYCSMPTPSEGGIRLSTPDGLNIIDLPVLSNSSNIVIVRSVNQTSPLSYSVFSL